MYKRQVLIIVDAVSRKYFTSETSWLWDIDFDQLNVPHVKRVILSGMYRNDLAERFRFTGVQNWEVIPGIPDAAAAIKAQGGTVGFMRMGLNMKSGPTAIVGKRVVVVGGGFAGLEVAEAMCDGREIWVIDPAKKLGNGIGIIDKNPTINLLKKKGVHLMPLTELIEVTKKGAKVKNVETGEEQLIECDTVLTSLGVEQNTDLYDEIVKVWPHAKLIGDATTPDGKVYRTLEAVKGGYQASMAI